MHLNLLKSKILRAEVTHAELHYEGSLAIDSELMRKVDLLPYEKILVGNINNGERLETYAIPAPAGSKVFSLNGAAAHKGKVGDLLVILAFAQLPRDQALNWKPHVIVLGDHNQRILKQIPQGPNSSEPLKVVG